ncbi:MAG: bifunctional indole-3-glycerol-phosphate synthase TrpC/phosphoribosylanthranilate isomerase TrpF [Sphingosinicella sp.]
MREPAGVLGEIVRRKRVEVAARLGGGEIEARPTRRSLAAALAGPGVRFIMEVKKSSPSAGPLAPRIDAAAQAAAYAGAASAISVLTDGPGFGGRLEDLRTVRRVFNGPILAKDFIVDPRQVSEARRHGADAVLAILAVLDDAQAAAVLRAARALDMDVLVEAHDAWEVRRAVALGASIVGINNRDLRTLKIDLGNTGRLAPLVPRDRLVVAESGVSGRTDAERLAPHADAILVGTSLMRAASPAEAARSLAFGPVKICGITNAEDFDRAAEAGATWAGFVMVPGTPRAMTPANAEAVLGRVRGRLRTVGIFRDEPPEQVSMVARHLGLDAVQLHGREDAGAVRSLVPGETEVWAAVQVGAGPLHPRTGADRLLFDSGSGGSGRTFDWSRVRGRRELSRGLLAGGLRPGNARAAARVGAWALDVGSGVERTAGRKDPERLAAFFEALRLPARGEAVPC